MSEAVATKPKAKAEPEPEFGKASVLYKQFGIPYARLTRWADQGLITRYHVSGHHFLLNVAEVRAYIESCGTNEERPPLLERVSAAEQRIDELLAKKPRKGGLR